MGGKTIPRDLAYFEARTRKTETGCWEWALGAHQAGNKRGGLYGRTSRAGEQVPIGAHVLSHEVFIGPVPDGYQVDHLCLNTMCVNPDHLEAVTSQENNRRRWASGVGANQNTNKRQCPKGHPYDMTSARGDGRSFRGCKQCYRDYQREYHRTYRAKRRAAKTED